jgi:hypothetical protein
LWPALIYCYLAGKARKSGVKITDVQADIWTHNFLNSEQECYTANHNIESNNVFTSSITYFFLYSQIYIIVPVTFFTEEDEAKWESGGW